MKILASLREHFFSAWLVWIERAFLTSFNNMFTFNQESVLRHSTNLRKSKDDWKSQRVLAIALFPVQLCCCLCSCVVACAAVLLPVHLCCCLCSYVAACAVVALSVQLCCCLCSYVVGCAAVLLPVPQALPKATGKLFTTLFDFYTFQVIFLLILAARKCETLWFLQYIWI